MEKRFDARPSGRLVDSYRRSSTARLSRMLGLGAGAELLVTESVRTAGADLATYGYHMFDAVRFAGHGAQPEPGFGGMGEDWQARYAQIRSPTFVFHGSEAGQGGASWLGDGFSLLDPSIEAYWYVAVGAPYIPIPTAWISESAVAWFRWQLLDDQAACRYVVDTMPASDAWDVHEVHSPRACE